MTLLDPRGDYDKIVSTYRPRNPEKGFLIRCPAHDDKQASLSVKFDNDRLLLKCHAGCAHSAILDGFYSIGVLEQPRAVSGERVRPTGRHLRSVEGGKARSGSLGKIVATYDYHDLNGALIHQVIKFEGRQYRQRKQNKNGEWVWSVSLNETILYRLKEVVEADTVYVCEGEKDAETVRSLGLVGTTGAMGAGKWQDRYAEAFTGKHIVILEDNDKPGRKHAQAVAVSAHGHDAKSIRIVDFPELPEHGDLTDWIEKGNGRTELEARVRKAPLWGTGTVGDPAWQRRLLKGDKELRANEENVAIALTYSPDLAGRVRYDAFRGQTECRDLPWDKTAEWRGWIDTDDTNLARYLQRHDVNIPSIRVFAAVESVAREHAFHPVRAYLENLKWDGVPRVRGWLREYAGARMPELGKSEDGKPTPDVPVDWGTRYLASAGTCFMVSACARIMEPGCQVDTMIILEGAQGIGKSTLLRALFGSEWFADQISDFSTKEYAVDLNGKWCVEMAELSVMHKSDANLVKSVVSRRVDHYRPPYGRRSADFARQNVFAATTNDAVYFGDPTGNRRYWPVLCEKIDLAALRRDRDQLWAEAVHLYRSGLPWHMGKEEEEYAKIEQAKRANEDDWEIFIISHLNKLTSGKDYVRTADLLISLGFDRRTLEKKHQMRVASILTRLGWKRETRWLAGKPSKVYARPSDLSEGER
jgi:predicted P-loop ATPase